MRGDDVELVVVGAGVVGLCAARSLARRGRRVVVCEQATVGHVASGSKGSARIFRLGYDEPGYVRLAMVAQRLWRELEAELDASLLTVTGQLTFGDDLHVLSDALTAAGASHRTMGADEVTARFPGMAVAGPALFEPESGVLAADTCLAALRRVPGVEVRENTRVLRCEDDGRRVRVVLDPARSAGEIRARTVIVCAGPWTGSMVAGSDVGLRPRPTLEQVAYLAPADGSPPGAIDEFPAFVERRRPWFYGLPVRDRGLMKVSLHGGGPAVSLSDLDHGAVLDDDDPGLLAELSSSAHRVLPGLSATAVATERCVYDNTPDGDFVLDRVGSVVVGSGTSGHGFKFAPLIGEVLADLATGTPHGEDLGRPVDLERFHASRLATTAEHEGPIVHR